MTNVTTPLAALLAQLEAPGTFATRLRGPADDLEIEVSGAGKLGYPVTTRTAQRLRAVARPSPFGLRDQTLHDPSVRDTWEIPARCLKLGRSWKPALAAHLVTLRRELGFPDGCELVAELDKLLVYEAGQFFKPHQDSEKSDDMVATLVVVLPSEYGGGALTVEHGGKTKSFRRQASQATELSLLAFYADCLHAVSPITSGVRVALTYRLSLRGRSTAPGPTMRPDVMSRLVERVQRHFSEPVVRRYERSEPAAPERLVYLLDHEYTERSLSWSRLKNSDRVRVAALRAAAERLDCECFLALAEVHETWMCEDDYDYRGRGRWRGWRFEEDERDDGEYELIELHGSEIQLRHWLDGEGRQVAGIPLAVRDEELHFTKASAELDPFKTEHEGYQGNYGNTVDRWYHRAAFVMWPRSNTFALRAETSPQWAVDELLDLPRSSHSEVESRIRTLLPRWERAAGGVDSAQFITKVVKLSARIDDPALARGWLAPVGLHRLKSRTIRRDLATVVDKQGLQWAKELVSHWTKLRRWGTPPWAPLLADVCEDLYASERPACRALAAWLLQQEAAAARERCGEVPKARHEWLDLDGFAEESAHLADVLAAAVAVSASRVLEDTTRFLVREQRHFSTSFFVQLLKACIGRSAALESHIVGSPLHRLLADRLEAVVRAPSRGADDWTISYPSSCECGDCVELTQFLRSKRTDYDWPLSEQRRRHIHEAIDVAKLPVRHTTLRRGSPYVLQLRKDASLFSRERAHRARVAELLKALPRLPAR